jgi:dTMP kinase
MFITFEGLDGSGKTTQIHLLATWLREQGYDVRTAREPGGTVIGDQIRQVLHSLKHREMNPRTELLLFNASRAQLVAEAIQPALRDGAIVLCDRFVHSTLAYQGYGHGLDLNTLHLILDFATDNLQPDFIIYLDISVEMGLQRRRDAARAGQEWNRLDAYSQAFHQRVWQGYQTLMQQDPQRWIVISALDTPEAVQARIRAEVAQRLNPQA